MSVLGGSRTLTPAKGASGSRPESSASSVTRTSRVSDEGVEPSRLPCRERQVCRTVVGGLPRRNRTFHAGFGGPRRDPCGGRCAPFARGSPGTNRTSASEVRNLAAESIGRGKTAWPEGIEPFVLRERGGGPTARRWPRSRDRDRDGDREGSRTPSARVCCPRRSLEHPVESRESDRRESNPHPRVGAPRSYRWTTVATRESEQRDSNPHPRVWKTRTLPLDHARNREGRRERRS